MQAEFLADRCGSLVSPRANKKDLAAILSMTRSIFDVAFRTNLNVYLCGKEKVSAPPLPLDKQAASPIECDIRENLQICL